MTAAVPTRWQRYDRLYGTWCVAVPILDVVAGRQAITYRNKTLCPGHHDLLFGTQSILNIQEYSDISLAGPPCWCVASLRSFEPNRTKPYPYDRNIDVNCILHHFGLVAFVH